MKKSIKRKWLKALRSGEYDQGRGQLVERRKGVDRFCCLGVLINETCGFDHVPTKNGEPGYIKGTDLKNTADLGGVRKQLKLPHTIELDLMYMNDKGATFSEIADYIEANVEVRSD